MKATKQEPPKRKQIGDWRVYPNAHGKAWLAWRGSGEKVK
jgi:hypothetical protein